MANLINLKAFKDFFNWSSSGGTLLMVGVIISLVIANSQFGDEFSSLLAGEFGWETELIHLRYPVIFWINDGLMSIFFLMVGLEIKREFIEGELSSFKKGTLPVMAALGGVGLPVLIFSVVNYGERTAGGWAIPMATDIAFALAIVGLLGKRVPVALKVFLAALAIVDDLMAVLVIAVFYSTTLNWFYILLAVVIFLSLLILNRSGVKCIWAYLIFGAFLWYFIHYSGIHATIAGVLVAITLPTTPNSAVESPLEKLEHILVKPVNFLILPLFALANTNIEFVDGMLPGLTAPLGMGIILGLFLGKPVGIFILSWISVKIGLSQKPACANWIHILGIGMVAGIGFTMSIFISSLSLSNEFLLAESKLSILFASILSAVGGSIALIWIYKSKRNKEKALKEKLLQHVINEESKAEKKSY
ncbi:Na+/H+ antiporter NhaA [Antarcticibacterium arcticum]|uniref:Na(+)/H(+) antiporter NhaA n=1 Tax=Antarcticibacterium arcticum TaxID=2585771 RepID=A0A5B8YN07_9FLAO|nr:Na+/H+ antiporter NhaA [Antarcticibacterium arcticum]QED37149.1 Na+/H+ antiporter NhaA [Antarcticibacterium arcticum]